MASTQRGNGGGSQGGKDIGRANWSKETLHTFVDLCDQFMERSKGKRGAIVSQRISWKKLEIEFQRRTNLAWDKAKLKNKYDWMRSRWSLWKQLKGKETGLGWDHCKGTISASDEWWNLKIQENSKFETFREEGIDPDFECKMDHLFGCSSAGGGSKYTPVDDRPQEHEVEHLYVPSPIHVDDAYCPFLDNHDVMDETSDLNNSHIGGAWEEIWRDSTPSHIPKATQNEESERRKGKRTIESDGSETNKNARSDSIKKVGGTPMIGEKLDNLFQSIVERNNAMTKFFSVTDASKYSVADALAKLCTLPDLEPGTSEFSFACKMIEDPQKRTIMFGLPNDKAVVEWIKFLFEERKKH